VYGNLEFLNILNIAISWGLLLLIWIVQIIIYPGLDRIPSKDFADYHRWYVKRISAIVLPLMILEVIITIGWLKLENYSIYSTITGFSVIIIWLSTFLLQVPIHKRLQSGKDNECISRLVCTNWIRTIAWSIKAITVTIAAIKSNP
jgi:hypothetical protein